MRRRGGGRGTGKLRSGAGRSGGLSAETKHLFKHWTFYAISHVSIYMVDVDVAVVRNEKKGRAARPGEDAPCVIVP